MNYSISILMAIGLIKILPLRFPSLSKGWPRATEINPSRNRSGVLKFGLIKYNQ